MEYNYNIDMLDEVFTIDGEELDISYCVLYNGGIELSAYYKHANRRIQYIDTFEDYYDEYELLRDLHLEFVEYLKTINDGE